MNLPTWLYWITGASVLVGMYSLSTIGDEEEQQVAMMHGFVGGMCMASMFVLTALTLAV